MDTEDLKLRFRKNGLKAVPGRLSIVKAITELKNHPTVEEIIDFLKTDNKHISTATVYKALNILVEKKILKKVRTEKDKTRYEAVQEHHHHLYCPESERIEDYIDEEVNEILEKYFRKKKIPGFKIEQIEIQIIGRFR
jgi:Fur family peroxide stress response transcriptional regulator